MEPLNLKKDAYEFIDSDTLRGPDSHDIRLRDVAGPESQHVIKDKGWFFDDKYNVTKGEYKGELTAEIVARLAKEGGYNNTVVTGDTGYFGRDIGDKQNDEGGSFTNKMLLEGILTAENEDAQRIVERGEMFRAMLGEQPDDIYSEARKELLDKDRSSAVAWKETAVNEKQLADEYRDTGNTWGRYKTNEVQNRHEDMNLYGEADNAFTTGVESGLNTISESAYGAISAIGDLFDSEGVYKWGKAQADAKSYENEQLGTFVGSIGDVNNIGDFGRYTAGMAGHMVPYLAGLFVSGGVGGIIGTATGVAAIGTTVAVAPPILVYAGEVYNNMEGGMTDKNVGAAIAGGTIAALLDRIGLKGIMKPSDFLKKDIDDQLVKQFAEKRGIPIANARTALQNQAHARAAKEYSRLYGGTIKEAAEKISKDLVDIQKELMMEIGGKSTLELNKRLLLKEGLHRAGKGGGTEMITEMSQEGLMYGAAVAGSQKEWDSAEFGDIVANAAAGGFILGGGISGTVGTTSSLKRYHQTKRDFAKSDGTFNGDFYDGSTESNLMGVFEGSSDTESPLGRAQEDIKTLEGIIANGSETSKESGDWKKELDKAKAIYRIELNKVVAGMDEEIKLGSLKDSFKDKGVIKTLKEFPRRFAQKTGAIIENAAEGISPEAKYTLYTLLDNFAPSNKSHMAGVAIGKLKQTLVNQIQRDMTTAENNLAMSVSGKIDVKGKQKASEMLVEYQRWLDSDMEQTYDNTPENLKPHIKALVMASDKINTATDALHAIVTKQTGEMVGKQSNYFSKAVKFDPAKIRKNKAEFMSMAKNYLGYSQTKAEEFYDVLVNGPRGYDSSKLDELGFKGGSRRPANLQKKTAELHKYDNIDLFTFDNKFSQARAIAEQDINYALDKKYIGANGEKVKKALAMLKEQMGDKWDPRIATHIMNSIDASRQDYNPIKNKTLRELQSWMSWYNATTQLHLSTLSSIPELAMMMIGATGQRNTDAILNATSGVAKKMRHDFKKNYAKVMKDSGYTENDLNQAVEDFYAYGYSHTEQGAIAAFDVEMGPGKGSVFREKTMRAFFNINLLAPFTDATRVARLAIANDAIFSDLDIIANFYLDNDNVTNYAADAWGRMRELNVNPHKMAAEYKQLIDNMKMDPTVDKMSSEAIHKYIKANNPKLLDGLDRARKSFVDNALANPNPVDRPLWYSNPHYRLMTQYNGFLSTFTAHILPKIWRNVKEGNPSARYNAVAAAAGMLALGFIGQGLKDEIDRDGRPPKSLTEMGYYQRGVMASGLFGTTERFINMAHPLYGSWRSPMDRLSGEAGPFTGSISNAYNAAERAAEGKEVDVSRLIPAYKVFNSYDNIIKNVSGE